MNQAVIIDCLRTPVGKAPKGIPRDEIEDVILGCANPEDRSARTNVAAEKVSRRSETCATWACKSLIDSCGAGPRPANMSSWTTFSAAALTRAAFALMRTQRNKS